MPGQLAAAMDEVRTVLRIERRVPHDKPDSFSLSTAEQMIEDFRKVTSMVAHRDGGAEFDWPAGGRHRCDEHHAGVGDRTNARDRDPQGAGGAAAGHCGAVSHRGGGFNGAGRDCRDDLRVECFAGCAVDLSLVAHGGAALGGGAGSSGVGGSGDFLRDLAGEQGGALGSGGGLALRVAARAGERFEAQCGSLAPPIHASLCSSAPYATFRILGEYLDGLPHHKYGILAS